MGTIIKLFIAALILNAAAQIGLAELKYYQFQDAVHEMMLFAASATDADIVKQTLGVAEEHDVPIDASAVTVTRLRTDIKVDVTYNEDVMLVPGLYSQNWTFNPTASIKTFGPGRLQK